MDFEFDPAKSAANKAKHGIDFIEAQALWLDDAFVEAPARTDDEPRFLVSAGLRGGTGQPSVFAATADADHLGSPGPQRGDRGL